MRRRTSDSENDVAFYKMVQFKSLSIYSICEEERYFFPFHDQIWVSKSLKFMRFLSYEVFMRG